MSEDPGPEMPDNSPQPATAVEEPLVTAPTEEELRAIEQANDESVKREMARRTRRAFLVGGVAAAAGAATWKWLDTRPQPDGIPVPFRRVLDLNGRLAQAYYRNRRLSPTFRPDEITKTRINGHQGLTPNVDAASWNLSIENSIAGQPVKLAMDDILRLPHREMITELRCIEGWSIVVKWTGVRLADLIAKFPPPTRDGSRPDLAGSPGKLVRYVYMETPARGYYVGLDMPSALHPQTLLAFAMNGQPLDWHHGAPLRLAIPVKYGIKNIKRIATIRYTDVRPHDFWADRGYDWYAGH